VDARLGRVALVAAATVEPPPEPVVDLDQQVLGPVRSTNPLPPRTAAVVDDLDSRPVSAFAVEHPRCDRDAVVESQVEQDPIGDLTGHATCRVEAAPVLAALTERRMAVEVQLLDREVRELVELPGQSTHCSQDSRCFHHVATVVVEHADRCSRQAADRLHGWAPCCQELAEQLLLHWVQPDLSIATVERLDWARARRTTRDAAVAVARHLDPD